MTETKVKEDKETPEAEGKQRHFKSGLPAPTLNENEPPAKYELGDGSEPVSPDDPDSGIDEDDVPSATGKRLTEEQLADMTPEEREEYEQFQRLAKKEPAVPTQRPAPPQPHKPTLTKPNPSPKR